jgi:hypothetical protein
MIVISHRGNLNGRIPEKENSPEYIQTAIDFGFRVEIDVWFDSGVFYLGHDAPQYKTNIGWLRQGILWCHAKNKDAFERLLHAGAHCFWHENDRWTMTSRGVVWAYPNNPMRDCILVAPEEWNHQIHSSLKEIRGVCTDYPVSWLEHNLNTQTDI